MNGEAHGMQVAYRVYGGIDKNQARTPEKDILLIFTHGEYAALLEHILRI